MLGRTLGTEWTKLRSVRSTYGSLLAAIVVTVGIAALAALAITVEFATDGILALSARSAAALTLTSLLVVGLGAVLRSAAGTITTAVAVLFAPPIAGALVSSEIVGTVMDYLPAGPSGVVASGSGERYSPEVAGLLLGAWAIATLAVGAITLHRRDP
jgi:ABC-2 type transport system permease protein